MPSPQSKGIVEYHCMVSVSIVPAMWWTVLGFQAHGICFLVSTMVKEMCGIDKNILEDC